MKKPEILAPRTKSIYDEVQKRFNSGMTPWAVYRQLGKDHKEWRVTLIEVSQMSMTKSYAIYRRNCLEFWHKIDLIIKRKENEAKYGKYTEEDREGEIKDLKADNEEKARRIEELEKALKRKDIAETEILKRLEALEKRPIVAPAVTPLTPIPPAYCEPTDPVVKPDRGPWMSADAEKIVPETDVKVDKKKKKVYTKKYEKENPVKEFSEDSIHKDRPTLGRLSGFLRTR